MSNLMIKPLSIITALIFGIFFVYNSLNFKLDASSDTLILQNDEDFQYFNYYNEIFPNKNFLVLAVKSERQIDQEFISARRAICVELAAVDPTIAAVLVPGFPNNHKFTAGPNGNIRICLRINGCRINGKFFSNGCALVKQSSLDIKVVFQSCPDHNTEVFIVHCYAGRFVGAVLGIYDDFFTD